MPCIAAPQIPFPSAALSLLLPSLSFSVPPLGVSFCCTLELPFTFSVQVSIGAILAPLGAGIDAILTAIDAGIQALNAILSALSVSCPFD